MSRVSEDLDYLRGAAASLESYLLSDELYWPLGGRFSSGMVSSRLSLGALLLTLARLDTESGRSEEVSTLRQQVESLRDHWQVHWEKKSSRELTSRLTLWQNALPELLGNSDTDLSVYAVEIRNRVMVELLKAEAGVLPEHEIARLKGLDLRLHSRFVEGKFVWDKDLQPAFPVDKFWYLYGRIRS